MAALLPSARSLAVAFALLVGGVGLYVVARTTSVLAVERVVVDGAPPGVAARVRHALEPFLGTSLVTFDEHGANRRIAEVADIAAASYDRDFPHTLRVRVRTEKPAVLLRRGREAWVASRSGRVLRQVITRPLPALPRVWLTPTADPLAGGLLDGAAATAALAAYPVERVGLAARSIRAVDGELALVLQSGTEVLLGDASRLRLKLAAAAAILPDAADAAYVDVSVPERAVVGMSS